MFVDQLAPLNIPADFVSILDVSLLKPDVTPSEIKALCEASQREGFHICTNSCYTALARSFVGSAFPYEISACVSFPFGAASTKAKIFEAQKAVEDGANEINMVMAIGLLKDGPKYYKFVQDDIRAVVDAVRDADGTGTNVIIETYYLTDAEKEIACRLASDAGAAFVQTSAGIGPSGAAVEDVRLMRRVCPPYVGVEAAGGIRTVEQCLALLDAGADRLGVGFASTMGILEEVHEVQF